MKIGDRVQSRPDMKIHQSNGTVLKVGVITGGVGIVLVEWDTVVSGEKTREIPAAWLQEIPAVDRLADIAGVEHENES